MEGRRIYFGPPDGKDWIDAQRKRISWRSEGAIQQAVLLAMAERAWSWERGAYGSVRVGHPEGLQAVVLAGTDFTADLLDAYVQRLEMALHLLPS